MEYLSLDHLSLKSWLGSCGKDGEIGSGPLEALGTTDRARAVLSSLLAGDDGKRAATLDPGLNFPELCLALPCLLYRHGDVVPPVGAIAHLLDAFGRESSAHRWGSRMKERAAQVVMSVVLNNPHIVLPSLECILERAASSELARACLGELLEHGGEFVAQRTIFLCSPGRQFQTTRSVLDVLLSHVPHQTLAPLICGAARPGWTLAPQLLDSVPRTESELLRLSWVVRQSEEVVRRTAGPTRMKLASDSLEDVLEGLVTSVVFRTLPAQLTEAAPKLAPAGVLVASLACSNNSKSVLRLLEECSLYGSIGPSDLASACSDLASPEWCQRFIPVLRARTLELLDTCELFGDSGGLVLLSALPNVLSLFPRDGQFVQALSRRVSHKVSTIADPPPKFPGVRKTVRKIADLLEELITEKADAPWSSDFVMSVLRADSASSDIAQFLVLFATLSYNDRVLQGTGKEQIALDGVPFVQVLQRIRTSDVVGSRIVSELVTPLVSSQFPQLFIPSMDVGISGPGCSPFYANWRKRFCNDPVTVSVATVEELGTAQLPQHGRRTAFSDIARDPTRVFSILPAAVFCSSVASPTVLDRVRVVLDLLDFFLVSLHAALQSPAVSSKASSEDLSTLGVLTGSAVVQLLIDVVDECEKAGPSLDVSDRAEIEAAVFDRVHQMFVHEPSLPRIVHRQGYPRRLLPLVVANVPSMHVCLDFVNELLFCPWTSASEPGQSAEDHAFAIDLVGWLSKRFRIPRCLEACKLVLLKLSHLDSFIDLASPSLSSLSSSSALPTIASFLLDVLPAARNICQVFPFLTNDFSSLFENTKTCASPLQGVDLAVSELCLSS